MGRGTTLTVDIVADAKRVGPGIASADSKLGKLGGRAAKMGKAIGAGLAVAGLAAGKFALDSVGAASRVQQGFGALESVYGRNARKVKAWASRAAGSVGLAKSEYADLSALVGSQLQGMGVATDKSAKQSDKLIRMGADLAATYGGSVKDAVGAVSSALKGETDPIERYGISLKQADVTAQMAAMGLDGLTGKAEKQARAQAIMTLLTQGSAKAQGAFARESNTLAGQQERLGAEFENLKATLGEKLLPVATKVVGWARRMLDPSSKLGGSMRKNLGPAFRAVGKFISDTLVPAGRRLYAWFVDKIAPGLRRTLTPILKGARSAFDSVARAVKRNEPELRQLGNAFRRVVEFIYRRVYPVLGKVLGGALRVVGRNISTTIDVVGGLVRGIGWLIGKVRDLIHWFGQLKAPGWLKSAGGWLTGSVGGLSTGRVQLVGPSPGYGPAGQLTAAAGAGNPWDVLMAGAGRRSAGGPVTIDARTFVTIDGALDEAAVARKLERVLRAHSIRMGGRR